MEAKNLGAGPPDKCPWIRNSGRLARDTAVFPFWAVLVARLWAQISQKTGSGGRYRVLGARWGPSDVWKPPNLGGGTLEKCLWIRNSGRLARDMAVFPFWAVLVARLWAQIGQKMGSGGRYGVLGARWGPPDVWKPPNLGGGTPGKCPWIRNSGCLARDTAVFPLWAALVARLWAQIGQKRGPAAGTGC